MSHSHKDNWRELAELLGLPIDEPAPAPTVNPDPPASSLKPEMTPVVVAPSPVAQELTEPLTDLESETTIVEIEEDFEEVAVEESEIGAGPEPMEPVEPLGEASDEEKPREERRGRRRGRRGRRRGKGEPEGVETAATPEGDAPADIGESPREDSRRSHSPVREEAAESEDDDGPIAADDGDTDDHFGEDLWADWNVPNWQELIDGLHRPDR